MNEEMEKFLGSLKPAQAPRSMDSAVMEAAERQRVVYYANRRIVRFFTSAAAIILLIIATVIIMPQRTKPIEKQTLTTDSIFESHVLDRQVLVAQVDLLELKISRLKESVLQPGETDDYLETIYVLEKQLRTITEEINQIGVEKNYENETMRHFYGGKRNA